MSDEVNKEKKRGIGTAVIEQLRAGKTNEQALEAVKAEFPDSGTTTSTVSWYRNDLRKKGEPIPTAAEARQAQAAPAADPLA